MPADVATFQGTAVSVPRTYKHALASPHAGQWREAMDKHLRMHVEQGTYREVIVPDSVKVLPAQWVFAIKTDNANEVYAFKARTVLLGNHQKKDID